ncbi:MAG: glycoside hydrolase family 127 protein [Planctomycetia bacterium]|nr:glycoside hydrolase family 127 protein [Planctomycetia bacterium]
MRKENVVHILVTMVSVFVFSVACYGQVSGQVPDQVPPQILDQLTRETLNEAELQGEIGRRIHELIYKNFMVVDLDRDWLNYFCNRRARSDAEGWVYYGIGKVVDAGSLFEQYTGDKAVADRTQYIVDRLRQSRDPDGYVGFWRVEPGNLQEYINWTLHEQEYLILGLVNHYRITGDEKSLEDAKAVAAYVMRTFPTEENGFYDASKICTAGLPEGFLELYRVTGDTNYKEFAANVKHGSVGGEIKCDSLRHWRQKLEEPPAHVYVWTARAYSQTLLYRYDGDKTLLEMPYYLKRELLEKGRGGLLVTGSCSEGEHFTYNQNGQGNIGESCVTAYMIRLMDSLLRLEGNLKYGDLIERTMYNALFAAMDPAGRRLRYFTPFTGERFYDGRDTFCCCGNFRRAMAELPQKVYYRGANDAIALNLFTASNKTFDVRGQAVTVRQETDYPNSGNVTITFSTQSPIDFPFRFRVPRWCNEVTVALNSEEPIQVKPEDCEKGYYEITRCWQEGDTVRLSMPMPWRFIRGRETQQGRVALMRGPIVWCLSKKQNETLLNAVGDARLLELDPTRIGEPELDATVRPDGRKVTARMRRTDQPQSEWTDVVLTEFPDPDGVEIYFPLASEPESSIPVVEDELFESFE